MKIMWNKWTKLLITSIFIVNAIFLIYYCFLSFYGCLHYDDIHFLWKMREMSILDYVRDMYFSRSGRFVAYGINGIIFSTINIFGFYQFWPIVFYLLGIALCWFCVKDTLKNITRVELFGGIWLFYNLYILTNIDFAVAFWLCALSYYLLAPACFLMLKYLNTPYLQWHQYLLLFFLVLFLGGGQEAFTPIVLLLMFVNGLYYLRLKTWKVRDAWSLPQVRRIVMVAVVLIILLIIVVVAPGNYARMSDTTQFIHPYGVIGWLKAIANAMTMFGYFMVFYVSYYGILFFIAFYFGSKSKTTLPISRARAFIYISTVFFIYLVISVFPNVYLYNGFGIQRNYTHIVFVFMFMICFGGYVLGIGRKSDVHIFFGIGGVVLLGLIMSVSIVQDFPTVKKYAAAVDERISLLQRFRDRGNTSVVYVDVLPIPYTYDVKYNVIQIFGKKGNRPVLYYISDTDKKANEYEAHMKKLYKLNYDFVLKSNP